MPAVATTAASGTWTPEAMEELLAPIALYPDPVLSQVLIASTNPQEVLDAGNWLLQNEGVKGKALDDAAAAAGFTPPVRALVQFPATVDMMCLEMEWTTELGQAFTADQAGVLDAVQRLRKQAKDVGNLESSSQMLVETEVQEGQEVVVLKPPNRTWFTCRNTTRRRPMRLPRQRQLRRQRRPPNRLGTARLRW